jgi:hypothetical protein
MPTNECAKRIVDYINKTSFLDLFDQELTVAATYNHMGAVLTDAVLQPGLSYCSVVYPRVQNVLKTYPNAITTIDFGEILNIYGAHEILNWNSRLNQNGLNKLRPFYWKTAFLRLMPLGFGY